MDGTLRSYQNMSAVEAKERIIFLHKQIIDAAGVFVILFHNIIDDFHDWPGWDNIFESLLQTIRQSGGLTKSLSETVTTWHRSAGIHDCNAIVRIILTR